MTFHIRFWMTLCACTRGEMIWGCCLVNLNIKKGQTWFPADKRDKLRWYQKPMNVFKFTAGRRTFEKWKMQNNIIDCVSHMEVLTIVYNILPHLHANESTHNNMDQVSTATLKWASNCAWASMCSRHNHRSRQPDSLVTLSFTFEFSTVLLLSCNCRIIWKVYIHTLSERSKWAGTMGKFYCSLISLGILPLNFQGFLSFHHWGSQQYDLWDKYCVLYSLGAAAW